MSKNKKNTWKANDPRVDLRIEDAEVEAIQAALQHASTHYLDEEAVAAGEKPPLAQTVVLPDGFTCIIAYQWCPDERIKWHARTLEVANDAHGKINNIHPSQYRVILGQFGFRCDDEAKELEQPAFSQQINVEYGEASGQGALFIQKLTRDEAKQLSKQKKKKPAAAAVS